MASQSSLVLNNQINYHLKFMSISATLSPNLHSPRPIRISIPTTTSTTTTTSKSISTSSEKTVALPNLRSSFPSPLHPLYDAVRSACEPWILLVAQPRSPSQRQFLLDCLLPRYVCRLFPNSPDFSKLCGMTKIIAWFTLADDFADSLPTSQAAEQWTQNVLRILHEQPQSQLQQRRPLDDDNEDTSLLLDALANVWGEISPEMPRDWSQRFVRAAHQHLEAVCLHSTLRNALAPADLTTEEFMAMRRIASGFPMGLELAPYALSINSDFHVLDHPLLADLRSMTVDHMCICNDVLSFPLEISKGDLINLPCVLHRLGAVSSLQEAVDCAAQMVNDIDSRCVELVHQIRADKELMVRWKPIVEPYVATLTSCMAGTIEWSYESARYGLPAKLGKDS